MKPTNHSTKISSVLRSVRVSSGTTGSVAASMRRRAMYAHSNSNTPIRVAVAECSGMRLSPGITDTQANAGSTSADSFRLEQRVACGFQDALDEQHRHPRREAQSF